MYYFTYASNMSLKQMKARCGSDNFSVVDSAQIDGFALAFTRESECRWKGGVADLVEADEVTWGVCYEINEYALGQLDCAEGYSVERPSEDNSYNRLVNVTLKKNGSVVEAYCYFANRQEEFIQPSKKYLDTLLEGAGEHDLPPTAIENIKIKGRYQDAR